MSHPDLASEQAYLDRLYERLHDEIEATRARLREVRERKVGGLHQAKFEREAFAGHLEDRLAMLTAQRRDDLCFGRIDVLPEEGSRDDGSPETGEARRFYIGRMGLADEDHEPLLIDWRAPAAAPFYQATPAEPQGVIRRRHFLTRGRQLVSIEDEVLDADALDEQSAAGLRGEAALQYAMSRARTGRMHEVAATLQREQDDVIRAPLSPSVFVQGGPGTGKTAVALHRAAFLLYTHRRQLSAQDVLVVGPNPVFLRYIENVLPSLGESGVGMSSTPQIHRRREWAVEAEPARSIKARTEMIDVIRRAIRTRERPLPRPMEVPVGGEWVTITSGDTRKIVRDARDRDGRHNPKAAYVHNRLVSLVWRRGGKRAVGDIMEFEDFREELLRDRDFHRVTARVWPLLSPEDLLGPVYGFRPLLREATRGVFPDLPREEIEAALAREWDPEAAEGWTDADAALLDEAERQLGPVPDELAHRSGAADVDPFADDERRAVAEYEAELTRGLGSGMVTSDTIRRRYGSETTDSGDADDDEAAEMASRIWRYAIVDEAQDLSPLQWRMVGRHCPRRVLTVVGDLAQGTEAWSAQAWESVADALELRDPPRLAELTINYRTPSEVAAYGAEILATLGLDLEPPEAVRSVPGSFTAARLDESPVAREAAIAARQLHRELADAPEGDGTVAVIGPAAIVDQLRDAVEAEFRVSLPAADSPEALDVPVAVMIPALAKGLEFDAVVLVDPDAIVREGGPGAGARALYVTATRATRRLHVLHTGAGPVADASP